MMLDAGAETKQVNSVGRTAAQMAAFVGETSWDWLSGDCGGVHVNLCSLLTGQHDCVTVINNFFSLAKLEFYTRPHGLEREPRLPPTLAGPLHRIIMTTNLNPVKVRLPHRSTEDGSTNGEVKCKVIRVQALGMLNMHAT